MFDSDDIGTVADIFAPQKGCGWIGFLVLLIALIAICYFVVSDARTCKERCDGSGRVVDGECYCVADDGSLRLAEMP